MRILVSHVGYDAGEPKKAVLRTGSTERIPAAPLSFRVVDAASGAVVFEGMAQFVGPVRRRAALRGLRDRGAPASAPYRACRVDVHGGWYDASGDRSKYLSHLSYAN